MNSRELMQRTIDFRCPERIPLADNCKSASRSPDFLSVGFKPAPDFVPLKPGMNEWGCVWQSLNPEQGDQGQVREHPLSDWSNSRSYKFPDPFAPGRLEDAPALLRQLRQQGLYVVGSLGKGPMHLLDDLRGFENYLTDLMLYPERIEFLLDGIFRFLAGLIRQYGNLGVDGVFIADDQAMQTGPLFAMDIWRQRFKPRYRALFDLAHTQGLRVHMHACGDLSQHLVELVEAGVNVIDNKQPELWMGSPAVEAVRGQVTFSTCIDIQTTIHTIAVSQIEEEVSRLIRRLSLPAGGFIGTCYPKPDLHIPTEKMERMLTAFQTFHWH